MKYCIYDEEDSFNSLFLSFLRLHVGLHDILHPTSVFPAIHTMNRNRSTPVYTQLPLTTRNALDMIFYACIDPSSVIMQTTSAKIDSRILTLPMLRLLPFEAQERKDFWKLSIPCHLGIHWIALTKYSQMSTMCQGFSNLSGFSHHFALAKLATVSKGLESCDTFLPLLPKVVINISMFIQSNLYVWVILSDSLRHLPLLWRALFSPWLGSLMDLYPG